MKNTTSELTNIMKNTLRFCVSALLVVSFVTAAFAQKETPPAGGSPKPFVFPKQDTYMLKNGMWVTLVQYGSVPKVAMQAVVRTGSVNEKPEFRWISDMAATMLKEGTPTRTAEDLARQTAEMGGSIFASASNDKTTIGGEVLSEFDVKFLDLMGEIQGDGFHGAPIRGRQPVGSKRKGLHAGCAKSLLQ
jgi:hypothetical protein